MAWSTVSQLMVELGGAESRGIGCHLVWATMAVMSVKACGPGARDNLRRKTHSAEKTSVREAPWIRQRRKTKPRLNEPPTPALRIHFVLAH